ncbi:MAG: 3-hydroxyacyl-[acyl-carrier-protein] dehydratase FabZ [Planctomycetota bacterium]
MASETTLMDRAAIMQAIPHRDPFLYVTRVVARSDDAITSEWDVPTDLYAFQGHYPGHPVLPGVLVCEFSFQSAAILFSEPGSAKVSNDAVPVLTKIEDARFKSIVKPGETLRAEVVVEERLANARYCKAIITSAGRTVCRLRFVVASVAEGV